MIEDRVALGLFVGKFSPLHLGHEWCIRQALERCRRLIILSWSRPELPGCEAPKRRRWLASRFPNVESYVLDVDHDHAVWESSVVPANDAHDDVHRTFVAKWCVSKGFEVDAVFSSENYGEGFAEHLGRALTRPVRHIALDPTRKVVAVSASHIRGDIHGRRQWLADTVYSDFVERIALIGGESTGKTSLAKELADVLETQVVYEYGRELWHQRRGEFQPTDMLYIAQRQIANESSLSLRANRYLICDTTPLVTLFYALDLFGTADPKLHLLARRQYHHLFICTDDFEFVQDGTRRDAKFRASQNAWYSESLQEQGVPIHQLTGSITQRVAQVLAHLRTCNSCYANPSISPGNDITSR